MRNVIEVQVIRYSLLILLLAILGLAKPLSAREKSDVIVMKNGDKITCEIKRLQSNTLFIKVHYILNTISVDWTEVDHVESKQLFLVKTQDGSIYKGALSTLKVRGERPVEIEVWETAEQKETLDREQVIEMSETSSNVWERFNGEFGLGLTYTKGNESTQYNFNTNITYVEDRWSAGATYTSNLNSSTGAATSTRNDFTLSGRRLLRWKNWYYTGLADFLQSTPGTRTLVFSRTKHGADEVIRRLLREGIRGWIGHCTTRNSTLASGPTTW